MVTADLNGDGLPDLVTADTGQNQISVYLNSGGAFFIGPGYATGAAPVRVIAADLNRDGIVDLVSCDSGANQLSVFLGKGDGTFTPAPTPTVATGSGPGALLAADLNGDGIPDLVCADGSGPRAEIRIFLGNGDGTFRTTTAIGTRDVVLTLTAADFNGDGRVDLVIAGGPLEPVTVLLGNGDGTFRTGTTIALGSAANVPCVAAADLNGDGLTDVVVVDGPSALLWVFLGNGDGTFRPATIASFGTGTSPLFVAAGDLNGDGIPDLVSADSASNQLSLFLGRGDGTFRPAAVPPLVTRGPGPSWIAVADLDGNGVLDVVASDQSGEVSIFAGTGDATFTQPVPPLPTGNLPQFAVGGDLNGDGIVDLVSADTSSNQLSVFLGKGDGTFSPPSALPTGIQPVGIALADLDGDGALDLVSGDGPSGVTVFLGNGDGTFRRVGSLSIANPGTPVTAVVAADLDGDGIPDLVVARESGAATGGDLLVFLGNGDGTFRTGVTVQAPHPSSIALADLNHDGTLDLVCSSFQANQLLVFLGNGNGTFTPAPVPLVATGNGPSFVVVADLDGDGNRDLVSADSGQTQLSVFLGKGDGTFIPAPVPILVTQNPSSVIATDIDGDGIVDLVAVNSTFNSLSIFRGRGNGTFTGSGLLLTGVQPEKCLAADLNGDGAVDLVSVDTGQNKLSVFLGAAQGPVHQSAFGTPRVSSPTSGIGSSYAPADVRQTLRLGPDLQLPPRARPYLVDTVAGTIDGVAPLGTVNGLTTLCHQGHAFHFTAIDIPAGATLIASGEDPLVLLSAGDVTIDGTIDANGAPGVAAGTIAGVSAGTRGGRGGPGAGAGGSGGGVAGAGPGSYPDTGSPHGQRGVGPGGGRGGIQPAAGATSGSGGGHGLPGASGSNPGGAVYGNSLVDPLFGGSGGGGGSARDSNANGVLDTGDDGGGGGGGGGGAVRITAGGNISVSGRISANGGGGALGNAGIGGNGGGGSGGSIVLQARGTIVIASTGLVSAAGGAGAVGGSAPPGGNGGEGRLRFEDASGTISNQGMVSPALQPSNVGVLR